MDTTVFVSSTCYDLIDVRAELEAHLRELGLSPIMSDRISSDFVGGAQGDSIETCLVNLRKSDVVLVILSQRYGPPLPDPYKGCSATHVEFQEAVRLSKPIHFYARDRLMGDYAVWRRDKTAKFDWVKDERQHRMFELLEERESTLRDGQHGPHAPSNWVWPFRDSIELKQRVAKDLQRESRVALLRRLIETGQVPLVAPVRRSVSNHQNPRGVLVNFDFTNAGPITALDVRWSITPSDITGWREVDVMPANTRSTSFAAVVGQPDSAGSPFRATMEVQYHTAAGHIVNDTLSVDVDEKNNVRFRPLLRYLVEGSPYRLT